MCYETSLESEDILFQPFNAILLKVIQNPEKEWKD